MAVVVVAVEAAVLVERLPLLVQQPLVLVVRAALEARLLLPQLLLVAVVLAVRPVPLPQEPEVAAAVLAQGLVASESLRRR